MEWYLFALLGSFLGGILAALLGQAGLSLLLFVLATIVLYGGLFTIFIIGLFALEDRLAGR